MRITPIFAALTAAVFLVACDDKPSCTQAQAQTKMTELMTKIQEVGATNPEKLAALAPKAQELAAKAQASGDANNLGEACKAIDEMMADLNK